MTKLEISWGNKPRDMPTSFNSNRHIRKKTTAQLSRRLTIYSTVCSIQKWCITSRVCTFKQFNVYDNYFPHLLNAKFKGYLTCSQGILVCELIKTTTMVIEVSIAVVKEFTENCFNFFYGKKILILSFWIFLSLINYINRLKWRVFKVLE